MARKFREDKLVLGTHNKGKIAEIMDMLRPFSIKIITAAQLGLIEPVEDGETYLDNALIKARYCAEASGLPSLADDSGIEVFALGNKPGLHTAPYTREMGGLNSVFNLWQQNQEIRHNPLAYFVCVQVLAWPDGHFESAEGLIEGRLRFPPCGVQGHGYDPIFVPNGFTKTVAEMDMVEKNRCSHRFLALSKLLQKCF